MVIKSIYAFMIWTLNPIKSIRTTMCYVNELLNAFNISFTSSISFVHPTSIHLDVPITISINTFLLDMKWVYELNKFSKN